VGIRHARGLLDTSVVIDLDTIEIEQLPHEWAVAAITMAELSTGPHATSDPVERSVRQNRLQRAEATFDALPFDAQAARDYGEIFAAVHAFGRKPRGARTPDLFIAATAMANELPLYTRNPKDLAGLEDLVEIVAV
jgi:hypothetical protein